MTKVWCIFETDGDHLTLFSIRSSKAKAEEEIKDMSWREASYVIEERQID